MSEKTRATVIFIIVGFLLLVIAYLTEKPDLPHFISESLIDAAFVLLTVGIVSLLWGLLGGEPLSVQIDSLSNTVSSVRTSVRLLADSRENGLTRLLRLSSACSASDWMGRLTSAKQAVDLMGYTLHVWTRTSTFGADVVGLVRNGVTVRFLVMDSTNPHLEALINSQQITALNLSQVKAELEGFQNQVRSIQQEIRKLSDSKGSFEFRTVKQGLTVNQICRFDDEIRVIPYLWSVVASSSPLLVIEGATTGLFKTYQAEFENLWEINGPNS